ncbi:uncharacterized protein LOC144827230 [Lissotriton helveticus]
MIHLAAEKEHLQENKDFLTKEIKKVKSDFEELKIENEQLKVLRSHSANQEALLSQLRDQLEVQEHDQASLLTEKLATMEDMHTRLRANIDSIHLLTQQLNTLSNDNVHLKEQLESEKRRCQQLDLKLETCNQTIFSLQALIKNRQYQDDPKQLTSPCQEAHSSNPSTFFDLCVGTEREPFGVSRGPQLDTLLRRDLDKIKMDDSMDKSYWIQRVGDCSSQLQESTEYYTEKINQLAHGISHSRIDSPQK